MDNKSQRAREPDGYLASLNMAIDTLNVGRDKVNVRRAKAALDSAGVLLATIRVRYLPAHVGRLLIEYYSGFGNQRSGFRPTGADLCWGLSGS